MQWVYVEIVTWTIQKIVMIMEHQIEMDAVQRVILNLVKDLPVILMMYVIRERTYTHVDKTVSIR